MTAEHDDFRESAQRFVAREVVPHGERWQQEGRLPAEVLRLAGERGFLGIQVPERWGGPGVDDVRFNAILLEEAMRAGAAAFAQAAAAHNDVGVHCLLELATDDQCARWLPGVVTGERIVAVAVGDPGPPARPAAPALRATRRDGDRRVDGTCTAVANAGIADLVIVAVQDADGTAALVVVERSMEGVGTADGTAPLGPAGLVTGDLVLADVRVPDANALGPGRDGPGRELLEPIAVRRAVSSAVLSVAGARAALTTTIAYVQQRTAFGELIAGFQNTRFVLAALAAEVDVGETYVARCLDELNAGRLGLERAAMAKLWCTELYGRATDCGVQLHGGYGFMLEYPIASAYLDARATRLHGGTDASMKHAIAEAIGL